MSDELVSDPEHSPEQIAFTNYWIHVIRRMRDPNQHVLEVSSEREVKEYVDQKVGQYKRRKQLGWSNPSLCESCRFTPGMCAVPNMNKLAKKGKKLGKVLACPPYLPGEKLPVPPDIPIEKRPPIVLEVDVEERKGEEWLIITVAKWSKKNNQYEIEGRGMKRTELEEIDP